MVGLKQSCKSQFLAVWKETSDYIEQGYTKKAIYNFFSEQKKISMSYVAWTRLINNVNETHPFAQKKSISKPQKASIKRGFHHNSTPYASQSDLTPPKKKEELKVNLISKKRWENPSNSPLFVFGEQ